MLKIMLLVFLFVPAYLHADNSIASTASTQNAHFEGKLLKIKKGCLQAAGQLDGLLELWFNNQKDCLYVMSGTPAFDACMCDSNTYCDFTVANITKKREKTLKDGWMDSYDGEGRIINYRKIK